MYLYICTLFLFCQSVNLSVSFLSRISLHLSIFEPNKFNQHTFPLILQQQTGDWVFKPRKPLSTVGSPVGPAWRRTHLCGCGRREPIWASKAPKELWGWCQQEKKWLHSLTWWGFWFWLPPLGSPLWPRPSFQVSVWSGHQKGHNPCGHSRFGAMAGGWP